MGWHLHDGNIVMGNCFAGVRQNIIERVNSGISTQLLKVKSHIGVPGNEMADYLANEARKLANRATTYTVTDYDRNNMYWLSHVFTTPHGLRQGRHICNLADGLHEICRTEWSQGFMNTEAVYYNICLLYTSPSPRDLSTSRMPSSA